MTPEEQWSMVKVVLVIGAVLTGFAVAAVAGFAGGFFLTDGKTETVTVGIDGKPQERQISNELLANLPKTQWATNGGSLSNERYSPLDQITTKNIGQVKGEWEAHLDGS